MCIVLSNDDVDPTKVGINETVRKNIGAMWGESVTISGVIEAKYADKVRILPFADTLSGTEGDLFENYLRGFFLESYRPVCVGNLILIMKSF